MTKKPTTFALRGAVCFSTDSSHLTCLEDAYLSARMALDATSVSIHSFQSSFTAFPVKISTIV